MSTTAVKNDVLSYSVDSDGIATITIDMVNHPTNLFSEDFFNAYLPVARQAIADTGVKGVIVTSAQRMFMAGGDLRMLGQEVTDADAFFNGMMQVHTGFRELETGGKPFVAAINGNCLEEEWNWRLPATTELP